MGVCYCSIIFTGSLSKCYTTCAVQQASHLHGHGLNIQANGMFKWCFHTKHNTGLEFQTMPCFVGSKSSEDHKLVMVAFYGFSNNIFSNPVTLYPAQEYIWGKALIGRNVVCNFYLYFGVYISNSQVIIKMLNTPV